MVDLTGREYAKLSQLKAGDEVTVDSDFDCVVPGVPYTVEYDDGLYIKCSDGRHFLDGQLCDDGDSLVGVYRAREADIANGGSLK